MAEPLRSDLSWTTLKELEELGGRGPGRRGQRGGRGWRRGQARPQWQEPPAGLLCVQGGGDGGD